MSSVVAALLVWLVYLAGWWQLNRARIRLDRPVSFTWWGAAVWLAVAVPSVLQFLWPVMLNRGARDPAAIRTGELWRLVTSLFLQDGGAAGTIFNLVTLGVTVLLAGSVVRGWALPVGFLLGGVGCNVLSVLTFAQWGAGNSMATMALLVAAALCVTDRGGAADVTLATLALAAMVALLVLHDQHGLAVALGVLLGLLARNQASLLQASRG